MGLGSASLEQVPFPKHPPRGYMFYEFVESHPLSEQFALWPTLGHEKLFMSKACLGTGF